MEDYYVRFRPKNRYRPYSGFATEIDCLLPWVGTELGTPKPALAST
jgi:hypothetical protein